LAVNLVGADVIDKESGIFNQSSTDQVLADDTRRIPRIDGEAEWGGISGQDGAVQVVGTAGECELGELLLYPVDGLPAGDDIEHGSTNAEHKSTQ